MKTLKHIILGLVLLLSYTTFAQQGINYKAIIKNGSGTIIANDLIVVQFIIYEGATLTNNVYQESHTPITDNNGLIILSIGTGTTSDDFSTIDWASDSHFLNVQINTGTGLVDMGTTEFMAVPYAKHAKTAEIATNVFSGNYNDLTNQPTTIPTGLEKVTDSIDSGTGLPIYGWRLIGVPTDTRAKIGEDAIDMSYSLSIANPLKNGATGIRSFTIGNRTEASGSNSTAMGKSTTASAGASTAMGVGTKASGTSSTAMGGNTIASGGYSTAMGRFTTAPSYAETVIGQYNTDYTSDNAIDWDSDDRVFVIGNGNSTNKSNALTVLKNGNIGVGRDIPSSLLEVAHANSPPTSSDYKNAFSIHNIVTGGSWQLSTVNSGHLSLYKNGSYRGFFNESSGAYSSISDKRLKKDIISFENGTLNKVMQLNPVSYLMKDQAGTKRNLGLISQEVQKIFPSITNYNKEADILTMSYTELIPILIKATQEQQEIIETLKLRIEALEKK